MENIIGIPFINTIAGSPILTGILQVYNTRFPHSYSLNKRIVTEIGRWSLSIASEHVRHPTSMAIDISGGESPIQHTRQDKRLSSKFHPLKAQIECPLVAHAVHLAWRVVGNAVPGYLASDESTTGQASDTGTGKKATRKTVLFAGADH